MPKPRTTALVTVLSRKDVVLDALREAIVTGELAPGQWLNLDEIAEQRGFSRMPVREALKQLESEGLVTIYPHRGVAVAALAADDIREIFALRIMLEQKAVELAIPRLTATDLAEMSRILERMEQMSARGRTWFELNGRFHHVVNAAGGWPRLVAMIEVQRANVERYVRLYVRLNGYDAPQRQHRDLYEACREGDAERAKAVVAQHFVDTADRLLAALGEGGACPPPKRERPRRRPVTAEA